MTLHITSDLATTYNVEIYDGPVLQAGSIAAGEVITNTIPIVYFINDEGIFTNKAIRVTAARVVVVYSYITRSRQVVLLCVCLPPVLAKEYYSMNFTQVSNEANSSLILPSELQKIIRKQKLRPCFTADITYAYHIGLNVRQRSSPEDFLDITKMGLDRSKTDFTHTGDLNDPAAGVAYDGYIIKINPDIGVGLWLYSRSYFIGISTQQVVPQKFSFADDAFVPTAGRLISHLFLTSGYRFLLNDHINAIPSLMVKYIRGSSENDFQFETNLNLQYRDWLWVGGVTHTRTVMQPWLASMSAILLMLVMLMILPRPI